jgi:hypothetical protein
MIMRRLSTLLIALFFIGLVCQACVHYVEEPTPPGQVAAPQPISPVSSPSQPAASGLSTAVQMAPAPAPNAFDAPAFRKSYRKAGSPRIAIFLNRTLSDDVREWRAYSRQVVSVGHAETSTSEGSTTQTNSSGGVAIGSQYYQEEPGRVDPGEGWMWRFEDGFLEPFLANGVNVVDRATIMRLAAAEYGRQGNAHDPVSVKQIEVQALKDKADLFIEILIREDAAADLGYEFKATAKEIETGIIRANVTSREWAGLRVPVKTASATSEGYTFSAAEGEGDMPAIGAVAEHLAELTMTSMAQRWGKLIS